jgi:hypothetical protein
VRSNQPDASAGESAPGTDHPGSVVGTPEGIADRLNRAQWLVAVAGLVAGLTAFGIGEATYRIIPARRIMLNTMGTIAPAITAEHQTAADIRNAALAFAVLGGCLGGCLGVAGGLARRSFGASVAAGLLGLLLAAGLAGGVSLGTLKAVADARVMHADYDMPLSMTMHGLIWGLSGAAAGLAFAVGLGGRRLLATAPAAGFAGAVLGAIAFDLIGACLFPLAETGDPVSITWASRLTARLLVALATAAGIILVLPTGQGSPASTRVESSTPPQI